MAVFLAVLAVHAMLLLMALRAARLVGSPSGPYEPLVVTWLRQEAPDSRSAASPAQRRSRSRPPALEPPQNEAITSQPDIPAQPSTDIPAPPRIDWQHEAELAALNGIAQAETEKNYRNLSGLSAQQLEWVKQNHMVPAPPGIEWTHPRFEFSSRTGLPIFWINDHCVLVMLMVFCGIGHIEPNGELFKHMHDPHDP